MKTSTFAGGAIAATLLLAVGIGVGRYLLPPTHVSGDDVPAASAPANDEPQVLYWYDPMVPDQHFDKPGKSPFMDMDLVPRYAEAGATAGVSIDPVIRQNLGIRTTVVERGVLQREIRAPGTLQWDLREEQRVSAGVDGIVERLHVATPYQRVRAGEPLATVLAPEWTAALAEYRALQRAGSDDARDLLPAARSRLRALGLTPADIDARPAGDGVPRITLRAPIDGVVAEVGVREGERVMAGQMLFRINGTAQIWMLADLPQQQADPGLVGRPAEVRIDAVPGETFDGTVEALLADLDAGTRTQRARIVLDDPDGRLAAGMFAEARLQPTPGAARPLVPSEALILSGDTARVIVRTADGRFEPVEVEPGRRAGGQVEVLSGLEGGEQVVVSGQFLIDSEASLGGLLRRLEQQSGGTTDDAHDGHGTPSSATSPADSHDGNDGSQEERLGTEGKKAVDEHRGHDMHRGHDTSALLPSPPGKGAGGEGTGTRRGDGLAGADKSPERISTATIARTASPDPHAPHEPSPQPLSRGERGFEPPVRFRAPAGVSTP